MQKLTHKYNWHINVKVCTLFIKSSISTRTSIGDIILVQCNLKTIR